MMELPGPMTVARIIVLGPFLVLAIILGTIRHIWLELK